MRLGDNHIRLRNPSVKRAEINQDCFLLIREVINVESCGSVSEEKFIRIKVEAQRGNALVMLYRRVYVLVLYVKYVNGLFIKEIGYVFSWLFVISGNSHCRRNQSFLSILSSERSCHLVAAILYNSHLSDVINPADLLAAKKEQF